MSSFIGQLPDETDAASEDEVFCDYLEARVQQALDTLNAAREALNAEPKDFNRAMTVLRHVHELRDLKAQLEQQRERVNGARQAVGLPPVDRASGQATPPPEFRSAQAEQAAKIMAALATKPRTCPTCQAPILDATTADCACEYAPTTASGENAAPLSRDALS